MHRFLRSLVVLGAALGVAAPAPASASLPYFKSGLVDSPLAAYSHARDGCKSLAGPLRDPITVMWYGRQADPVTVAWAVRTKVGWAVDDNQDIKPLHDRPQELFTRFHGCQPNAATRASKAAIVNRDHIRIYRVAEPGDGGRAGFVTAGTAHHDIVARKCGFKHKATFVPGRRELVRLWRAQVGIRQHRIWWGNTRAIEQCDGSMPANDGWVAYLRVPNSYPQVRATALGASYSDSVGRPEITGSPQVGGTLHATAGEWYPQPTTSFEYQWCAAPPNTADADLTAACAPIPGATSSDMVVTPALTGSIISVRVTPNGAGADVYAYSDPAVPLGGPTGGEPPRLLAAPTIVGCGTRYAECRVEPGTWEGADEIAYVEDLCSTELIEPCQPESTNATARVVQESDRYGCWLEYPVATVIARNPVGTVRYPIRGESDYLCTW